MTTSAKPNSGDSIRNSWTGRVSAIYATADPGRRSTSVCKWPLCRVRFYVEFGSVRQR